MTLLTDDFSSGTYTTNWDFVGNTTPTVTSGRLDLLTSVLTASRTRVTAKSISNQYTELLVDVYIPTSRTYGEINLVVDGTFATTGQVRSAALSSGVVLKWINGTVYLQVFAGGSAVGTQINDTLARGTGANVTFRLQRTADGHARARWWTAGTTEPGTWNLDRDISAYTIGAGVVAISNESTNTSSPAWDAMIDNVVITDISTTGVTAAMDTATATAQGIDPTFTGHDTPVTLTRDVTYNSGTSTEESATDTTLTVQSGVLHKEARIEFDSASIASGATVSISKATLRVKVAALNSVETVEPVGSTGQSKVFSSGSTPVGYVHAFDVTDAITTVSGTTKRITLAATNPTTVSSVTFASLDSTTSADRPTLEIVYTIPAVNVTASMSTASASSAAADMTVSAAKNITVSLDTATASALANDVTTKTGLTASASTATASAQAYDVDASGSFNPDVTAVVETAQASAQASDIGVSLPVTVALDTATATADAGTATVATTQGTIALMTTAPATATAIQLASVNGEPVTTTEDEDLYFVSTYRSLDPLDYWYRLNERSGNVFVDRTGGYGDNLINHGVTIGLFEGPAGRHNVRFNGDSYIEQIEPSGTNADENVYGPNSLEFTFRTTKSNQFLMLSKDNFATVNGSFTTTSVAQPTELILFDGKLMSRTYKLQDEAFTPVVINSVTGTTNLADGNWHHIVVQQPQLQVAGGGALGEGGLEIYVDGKLEIRRRFGGFYAGMPDFIGWRPDWVDGSRLPAINSSDWFVGDLTELVFRNQRRLSADEVAEQRNSMFGIIPVKMETARATTKADDVSAKGNKTRVLVLDFSRYGSKVLIKPSGVNPFIGYTTLNHSEAVGGGGNFEFIGLGEYVQGSPVSSQDLAGFQFFYALATVDGGWRDKVTDNLRLIDLEEDLNMDDYDMVSITNYPITSEQRSQYEAMDTTTIPPFVPAAQQLERVLNQLTDWVADGGKLFVNDPASAVALGIVDRVEYVPTAREAISLDARVGAFTGIYDWRAASIDPWANPAKYDPQDIGASRYSDLHANTRQRVRALVPGLTDQPSWIITDAINWQNADPLGNPPFQDATKYVDRTTGLRLGDEFYLQGASGPYDFDWIDDYGNPFTGSAASRQGGWLAAPIANVKTGTVVTSFANKLWMHKDEIDNPYKDYAVSIIVEPGDQLGGREIAGKVYVNFTEAWTQNAGYDEWHQIQVVPETAENADKRYWNWSTYRGTWTGSSVGGGGGSTVTITDGGAVQIDTERSDAGLVTFRWSGTYPIENVIVSSMATRALRWLANTDEDGNGNVTVGLESAQATATASDLTITAGKSVSVVVETARANATSYDVADATSKDANAFLDTATATAKAGYVIDVAHMDTATATAQAYDLQYNWNDLEVVYLTMPVPALTLYMEEA